MKIKLTPELSYIIGLWRKCKTKEGLGIYGGTELISIFSKEVIEKGLTTSDRLLSDEEKVYFYHTAYRKFFQSIEEEQLERFKYMNEYAASYLAGMFDCSGEITDKGIVALKRANRNDEMLLIRLGFGARWRETHLIIEKPKAFLAFIRNYVKRFAGHQIFQYVTSKKREKQAAVKV